MPETLQPNIALISVCETQTPSHHLLRSKPYILYFTLSITPPGYIHIYIHTYKLFVPPNKLNYSRLDRVGKTPFLDATPINFAITTSQKNLGSRRTCTSPQKKKLSSKYLWSAVAFGSHYTEIMEKLLHPYDKEYMRMAMLKHEETFREQVYELHRLYRIQKILMQNISSNRQIGQPQGGWNFKNSSTKYQMVDLERPADQDNNDAEKMIETVDESELELTLGPSSFSRGRMTAAEAAPGVSEQRPLPSDSVPSFSSSSTGSSHIMKRTSTGSGISCHQKMSGNNNSEVDGHPLRQDVHRLNNNNNNNGNNNNPPWLFQVLRLNVT